MYYVENILYVQDVWAYRAVGIPIMRIFTINHRGELKHELTQTFQSSWVLCHIIVSFIKLIFFFYGGIYNSRLKIYVYLIVVLHDNNLITILFFYTFNTHDVFLCFTAFLLINYAIL